MSNSDITIVIPVYNRADLIGRTLKSIADQTLAPERVIVVDNNSTDNSLSVLREWASRSLPFRLTVLEEKKPGAAAARNCGLHAVETPYLMFFDSDDTMRPDHIEKVSGAFSSTHKPDLVYYPVAIHFDDSRSLITKAPSSGLITSHIVQAIYRTQGTAMTAELARRAGEWNEALTGWDDLEFGLRVGLKARSAARIDSVSVDTYHQSDSLTGDDFSSKRGVWEKALDEMDRVLSDSTNPEKEKWRRWVVYRRVILAAIYSHEQGTSIPETYRFPDELVRNLPCRHRAALRIVYEYTRRGGRGAYYFYRLVNGW